MILPDPQMKALAQQIAEEVVGLVMIEIRKELDARTNDFPPSSLSPFGFDQNTFSDKLLESVRQELRLFKQEVGIELAQDKLTPSPSQAPENSGKKSSWLDKKLF